MFYNPILQFVDYLRYREAVKQADNAHEKTGERYYVMPVHPTRNDKSNKTSLIILNRNNFRKMKKKHYINHNATQRDLVNECFYCTTYSNGNGYLDEAGRKVKLANYFSYCKATRQLYKERKHENKKTWWQRILHRKSKQ